MTTHWTLGVLVGLPIAGLFTLIGLFLVVVAIRWHARDDDDWPIPTMCAGIVLVVTLGITALGMFPYHAVYHQWRPVTGQVTEIGKRLIADGKSMSERYVLVINGQPYGVDDTRASLVKVGETHTISCRKDWQWAATPGYVCRWIA